MYSLIRNSFFIAFLFLLLGFATSPQEANAQRWLQTAKLVSPIQSDGPVRPLLDTLVQVMERKDGVMVKRTPDSNPMGLSELRDKLINESGVGLQSANNVFIDYKFEIKNRGFQETITSLQFIYRPTGEGEDIQMMYVDTSKPWVKDVLRNKGTTLTTNEAALETFSDQLAFARMEQNGQIVEIANQTVREGFEAKKRQLVQKIRRLTYQSR